MILKNAKFLGNSTGVAVGAKSDTASYADKTSGRPVSAVNHILALKKLKYINYIPFQGRMSSFYYSAWQKWDPTQAISGVASVHGLGRDTADNYYSSQTLGYRVIPPWAEVKKRTSSWGGAPQHDTYKTLKEGDWLFDKPLQKKAL